MNIKATHRDNVSSNNVCQNNRGAIAEMGSPKKCIAGLFAIILISLSPSIARATTETVLFGYANDGYSDSTTINLEDYSVTTISNITVTSTAYAAGAGSDDIVYAWGDAAIGPYGGVHSVSAQSTGGVYINPTIVASDITKNGSGHWIAAQLWTPDWVEYNVDLGTGSIELLADGNAIGLGAYAYIEADITY
jgi:hypothetical protein